MKKLYTEIEINADVQTVWNQLTAFEFYPEWNPFIRTIEGKAEQGSSLKVQMDLDGKKQVFRPKVLVAKPGEEFRWKGKLWVKGLFDGEHFFKLEVLAKYKTRLVHGEKFSGVLSGLILKMIEETTLNNFEKMNQALKSRCEKMICKV